MACDKCCHLHCNPVAILACDYHKASSLQAQLGGQGSWLVSGGVGALGILMGAWLANSGSKRINLLGRSGRTGGDIARKLRELFTGHASVTVAR